MQALLPIILFLFFFFPAEIFGNGFCITLPIFTGGAPLSSNCLDLGFPKHHSSRLIAGYLAQESAFFAPAGCSCFQKFGNSTARSCVCFIFYIRTCEYKQLFSKKSSLFFGGNGFPLLVVERFPVPHFILGWPRLSAGQKWPIFSLLPKT